MNKQKAVGATALVALFLSAGILYLHTHAPVTESITARRDTSGLDKREASHQRKKARAAYFFQLLRDPLTDRIPENVRLRELAYARRLPTVESFAGKTGTADVTWAEAGPSDVGGRTRALAIDVTNPNVVLAGGASGGLWKSTDGGASWALKTDPAHPMSVTSLAQDPRPGHTNTWFYASGEYAGSAGDQGGTADLYGSGLWKSTDGGEQWQLIQTADDPTQFDSPFDYVSNVFVHPATGSVFVASNQFGILRSDDGGASFTIVLGGANDHEWSDIDVTADGELVAVLSSGFNDEPAHEPGVYLSDDDGQTWSDITPDSFPDYHSRSVLAAAPSNPDVVYVLTWTGDGEQSSEDVRFHVLDLGDDTSEDRSENLPDFGEPVGYVDTQGGYNMVLAVRPDDEDFVVFGTTNLWRSRDGFATPADDLDENWIGGYATSNDIESYEHQHPDQHALVFDPQDPNTLLSGHDGGLSRTTDVGADVVVWESLNNGYNVTQFYTVAVSRNAGDTQLVGGTQDNGSPYFQFDGFTATASLDISTGDGAYAYLGDTYAYASAQEGAVVRLSYGATGQIDQESSWSWINPSDAEGMLFINPFTVDPVDEDVMYYLAGDVLWRNDRLSDIPDYVETTSSGWTALEELRVPEGYVLSTLAVSTNPAHVLYYGASSYEEAPRVYRLENATTATAGAVDISIPEAAAGAYVHSIAVSPEDADEILVVFSNYNVESLFHSTDGGQTYTAVEGNLEGDADVPGPSIRSAAILPLGEETVYVAGTSTGLYSTTTLDGTATTWKQEASQTIGNTVVNHVVARPADGKMFAATHGRGLFVGTAAGMNVGIEEGTAPAAYELAQNYPNPFNPATTLPFVLPEASVVSLTVFDVNGRKVADLLAGATLAAGRHAVRFDAGTLAGGVYLYRLNAMPVSGRSSFTRTMRMTLVK